MSVTIYHDKDANQDILKGKKVAVIGYGAQGRAQARMMFESGVDVIVGVRENGPSWKQVQEDGLPMATIEEAVVQGDIIHILIPDEHQKKVFADQIQPNLSADKVLSFSHGFSIVFNQIEAPKENAVIMVSPKCPGTEEYKCYRQGFGVPALVAVHQDNAEGTAMQVGLAMCKAMFFTKAGVIECTFEQETYEDLFGEQAVLCGGMAELIQTGFEVLTEGGYPPELAYFECLHEAKLIVDIMYDQGISEMWSVVSNTAEYGGQTRGRRVITQDTKNEMKKILKEVEDGTFARQWMEEVEQNDMKNLLQMRKDSSEHGIEKVGAKIRSLFEKDAQ